LLVVCAFVRKMDKEAASWWKGYKGEVLVAKKLIDELPNTFWVINDIQTPLGNFDHVVVGPTGVFAVETKNWRGWVTPDGKGELLVNGKPVGNHVRTLYNRIMGVKGRLTKTDRYIQGVMVFASAYEDAPWGTTQSINCISIDSIPDYFTKMQRPSKPLSPNEVDAIAQAFQEIGRLDKDFTVRTKVS